MAIHNFAAAWMTDEHQMLFDTASRFFKEQWAPKDEAWRQARVNPGLGRGTNASIALSMCEAWSLADS